MLSYDYVDSDPVVPVRLISPTRSSNQLAFLDTGSDGLAIPRDLWDWLNLGYEYPVQIQSVTGYSLSYLDYIVIEIFGDRHQITAVRSDDSEILIGKDILDQYIICYDGIHKKITVKKEDEYES
ncbi:MAG: hypothetical protein ACE5KT_08995 [Methanosarcinales archaeon]